MFAIERLLRSLHTWPGVMILPWVIIAGVTGLYMNHSALILSVFPVGDIDGPVLRAPALPQTEASAAEIVKAMYPSTHFDDMGGSKQNGRQGYKFIADKFEAVSISRRVMFLLNLDIFCIFTARQGSAWPANLIGARFCPVCTKMGGWAARLALGLPILWPQRL